MLGLAAAASAIDAAINKKVLGYENHTTLVNCNDDMQDLLKIVKSLEDSGLLLDGITETVKNEVKEQKSGFLSMVLGTLGASLKERSKKIKNLIFINLFKYKTMISYCLKCKKILRVLIPNFLQLVMVKQ